MRKLEIVLTLDAIALIVSLKAFIDASPAEIANKSVALDAGGASIVGVDDLAVQGHAEEAL